MTRFVLVSAMLLLLAAGLAAAQGTAPVGTGPVPGHGIPIYYFEGGGRGGPGLGGPPLQLYAPIPPHGIDVIYAPGGGGLVLVPRSPTHGPPVPGPWPGPGENTGGAVGPPAVLPATVLYPDFSPQGMADATRRGDGWPWEAPAAFRTPAMQQAGVTAAWQALEAYRRLFTRMATQEWAQTDRDICDQGLQMLTDRVGQPLFATPSAFQWAAEQVFADLRAGAWSGPTGHTAHPEEEAAPPPDPAVWAIWALNMGGVQGADSALALDQILGRHLTDASAARGRESVRRLPGGPRYLAGLDLRTGAAPLVKQAQEALAACDPTLFRRGIQPLQQAAHRAGYLLLGATVASPDEAQLLFASHLEAGQAWCVTAYLRDDLSRPASAQASLPEGVPDRLRSLLTQATGKPAPKLTVDCYTQVTTPQGKCALWKLQAGKWAEAGKTG